MQQEMDDPVLSDNCKTKNSKLFVEVEFLNELLIDWSNDKLSSNELYSVSNRIVRNYALMILSVEPRCVRSFPVEMIYVTHVAIFSEFLLFAKRGALSFFVLVAFYVATCICIFMNSFLHTTHTN